MTGKAARETLGMLGVIASMLFVGLELRQSNVQARAAAYQAVGIATAEFHRITDERWIRISLESRDPTALVRWTPIDWELLFRSSLDGLRMAETVQLQVEQAVLPADAMERLGYNWYRTGFLSQPAAHCIWPMLRSGLSATILEYVERTPQAARAECPSDLPGLETWSLTPTAIGSP